MKILATLTLFASASFCAQPYPGTSSRPILSDKEAALFTQTTYLQGWAPPPISVTSTADYIVGGDGYSTIQAAVNDAIKVGGTTRKYIKITEGTYNQIVYIPPTNVPITLYGAGSDASATVISLNLSATSTGADYKKLVENLFNPTDRMYKSCARKAVIGTSCSSIIWVKAPNVQIINLTIENLSSQPGIDQAVALYTQGDKVQISNCRILSHQSTFWSGATGTTITRGHVTNTYIEGDLDFVFGGGSTVFEGCTFYAKSDRRDNYAIIFAPATDPNNKYGYLVNNSTISGDGSWSRNVYLARSWDAGVIPSSTYLPGRSPNGQLVVRESTIDGIIPSGVPYYTATSGRPYAGNKDTGRDLNGLYFNRFWEYGNTGDGA